MIIQRSDGDFYIKETFCRFCGYSKAIPIMERPRTCHICNCKRVMDVRWKSIGNKLDYTEYFSDKNKRKMMKEGNKSRF